MRSRKCQNGICWPNLRCQFTNFSITSLLSIIRASLVLQRVELTKVAEYPAKAVKIAISLIAVGLLFLSTTKVEGTIIPKKVA